MSTLLLVDDHPIVRDGIRAMLGPDMRVVAETGNGFTAVELAAQMRPDVISLDLLIEGQHGLMALEELRKYAPTSQVVVVSTVTTEQHLVDAIRKGALSYVVKTAGTEEIVHALRLALSRKRYFSAPFSPDDMYEYFERAASQAPEPYDTLTTRERQVLYLIARGLSNLEIADQLFLGQRTVETHRENMLRKLGVRGTAAVTRIAIQRGLLEEGPGMGRIE